MSLALLPVTRQLLMRSVLWALIGAIYTPLFIILEGLMAPYLGHLALAAAAAGAGVIGAAYYSARQAALVASVVGVVATLFLLVAFYQQATFLHAALLCGAVGMLTGLMFKFPRRCTENVVGKSLVGGLSGLASGGILTAVAMLGVELSPLVVVAFLVSVNGVIYVALVRRVVGATGLLPRRWCPVAEGVVIGAVAIFFGGAIWAFASTLSGYQRPDAFLQVVESTAGIMPLAVAAGVASGIVTGGLLELFGFDWVDDL